jgi:cell division protein FtsW
MKLRQLFTETKRRSHIDLYVLVAALVLMVFSLGVVYSASASWAMDKWKDSEKLLSSHAAKVVIGFLLMFLVMQIDYNKYKRYTKPALFVCVLLLLVTLALGGEVKGASRWFRLGGFGLQPSEVAKLLLIMHLARFLSERKDRLHDFQTGYLPLLFWIGLIVVLVLAQPSFSNGSMILLISASMLYLGGVRLKHLLLTAAPALPLLGVYMMGAQYRRDRVASYLEGILHPGPQMHHQVWQSILGFGSGGILGLGPGMSQQRELYLPESYGDFIFAIIGEEYGLIGTCVVLALFLVILIRGIRIAQHAPDEFGRNLAYGITLMFTLYALVNAGVTLALLPTTGLPMPFISYGGSSMVFSLIAVGILLNISTHTDLEPVTVTAEAAAQSAAPPRSPAVGRVF